MEGFTGSNVAAESVMDELKTLREDLKSRLETVSELELQLLTRKRRLMQNEIKVEHGMQQLDEREEGIRERECYLLQVEQSVRDYSELMKKNETDFQRHKSVAEENRRLKDSFATLCSTNLHLKKQLDEQGRQNTSLKRRVGKLQTRLSSLHTVVGGAQSASNLSKEHEAKTDRGSKHEWKTKATQTIQTMERVQEKWEWQSKPDSGVLEQLLSELMEWLLRDGALKSNWVLNDKFCGMFLPLLAAVLPRIQADKHGVVLRFICWILQRMNSDMKVKFSATLRRIGDTCARGKLDFSNSTDANVRIYSSLLTLQTLSQADLICSSLERLKQDLSLTEAQALFLSTGGVKVLLPYFQSTPKYQVMSLLAMDIFVLVSSDSGLIHFLNRDWFSAAAGILSGANSELSEKLIILLQRLSTMRTSKDLFDKCGITTILQSSSSYLRSSHFVQLNVASILRNLSS